MPLDNQPEAPDYSDLYVRAADQHNLDPRVLRALATRESNENHLATNRNANGTSDRGLMQINDATAPELGVTDPYDPEQSVFGGARYLRQHLDAYKGDYDMAIAAYHRGPSPDAWDNDETRGYVRDVQRLRGAPTDIVAQAQPAQAAAAPTPPKLHEFRLRYPQYDSMSDADLVARLHDKFYSAMPFDQFAAKLGYKGPAPEQTGPTDWHKLPMAQRLERPVYPADWGRTETPPPQGEPQSISESFSQELEQRHAADQRIWQAAKEGYQNTPEALTPLALDWADKHGLGTAARAGSAVGHAIVGTFNAAWSGGIQAAYEFAKQAGLPETLARDIAATVETAGMTGAPHVPLRETAHAAQTMNALREEALNPAGFVHPEGAAPPGAPQQQIAPPPQAAAPPKPPAGSPEAMANDIAKAKAEAAAVRQNRPQRPLSPEQAAMAEEEEAQAAPPPQAALPAPTPPAPPRVPTPRVSQVETPPVIAMPGPQVPPESRPTAEAPAQPVPEAPRLFLEPPQARPPEPPAPGQAPQPFAMVDPSQLRMDPERFQYKASDTRGVTGALLGTNRWEPDLANPITAWQGRDGQLYVVNGHQRTDLALRAQAAGQNVQMPARIFRAEDGYTPDYMRALGAYQNIAEGSGTAIDAAKVLRGRDAIPADRSLPSLPPRSQLVQQANGLAKLTDRAFGMVESGAVPASYAAHVGELIEDPAEQIAATDALARANPANSEQARIIVNDIRNSGFLTGDQTNLFGTEAFATSLFPERARILDNAMRTLRRARSVFKSAVEGEETLSAAGNQLSREGNLAGKTQNEKLLDELADNATKRGPLSDALSVAARELADGKPIAGVTSRFLAQARRVAAGTESQGVRPGAPAGGAGHPGETTGLAEQGSRREAEAEARAEGTYGQSLRIQQIDREMDALHSRMVDETMARGAAQSVHSFDVTPQLRTAIAHDGLALFQPRPPRFVPGQGDIFGAQRQAPAKREAEPTIRTDKRQEVIPGTEPSAVQAQAARDQAGRGALMPQREQMPANEGLFARQEAPTGDMFAPQPAKSRWPIAIDQLHEFPEHTPETVHHRAIEFVVNNGRRTGYEHIAVVDRAGNVIHAGSGRMTNGVPFDSDWLKGHAPDDLVVHHNHPSSSSLSVMDWMVTTDPAVSHVVAIGHDGTLYVGNFTPEFQRRLDALPRRERLALVVQHHNYAYSLARGAIQSMLNRGDISTHEANGTFYDVVNRILAGDRVVDYVSGRELPPPIARWLIRLFEDQGHDRASVDRLTKSVRPQEGAASLPRPMGAQSPGKPAGRAAANPPSQAGPGRPGSQGRLLEPEQPGFEGGEGLYSFPGMLFNPAMWKRLFGRQPPPPPPPGQTPRQAARARLVTPEAPEYRPGNLLHRAKIDTYRMFSPTSIGGAKPQEMLQRRYGAERAQSYAIAEHTLREVRDGVDRLSKQDQEEFTYRMETGQGQLTPELDQVAAVLRKVIDEWTAKVQSLGRGYLQNTIDDYMGHIWGNYQEWKLGLPAPSQAAMNQRRAAAGNAKTPLRGSGNFLKKRFFPTQREGIAAGLVPITWNPIDLQLLKIREMQKWYHGTKLADDMKASGLAVWIPDHDKTNALRSGMVPLDDRVFQPVLYGQSKIGPVVPGVWMAQEPVARIFNNAMSRSLLQGQNVFYDLIRGAANGLNTLQLGLSGFHAAFVTIDTAMSESARGLGQITDKPAQGIGRLLFGAAAPATVARTYYRGKALERAFLDDANASPELRQRVEDLLRAGGRIHMDSFYRSSAAGPFFRSFKDFAKNPLSPLYEAAQFFRDQSNPYVATVKFPFHIAGRVLDQIQHPLMGVMVPRAKLGVFANLAADWSEKHPYATPMERNAEMIRIWDSVDNRLGEMVYDNLFWRKTQKDMAFVAVRSVGWNLGTVREIGGAGADATAFAHSVLSGKRPQFTYRMAYSIVMPLVTMLYGAMLTYLMTGHGPQQPMDYFFPPSSDEEGADRISIPGYTKDVIEFWHNPKQTAVNKLNPLPSYGAQLWQNEDYYGGIIYDPARDARASAYLDSLVNTALPFGVRSALRLSDNDASMWQIMGAFFGFQPAPKSITQPERGEAFQNRANLRAYRKREREPGRVHIFSSPP